MHLGDQDPAHRRAAPLARQPRLLRGDDPRTIETDEHGNVLGGVRLPEIQVPTATYEAKGTMTKGARKGFPEEKLLALYPTNELYLKKIKSGRRGLRSSRRAAAKLLGRISRIGATRSFGSAALSEGGSSQRSRTRRNELPTGPPPALHTATRG